MGTIVETHDYILSRLHEARTHSAEMAYRHGSAETASFDMYREIERTVEEAIAAVEDQFGSMTYELRETAARPIAAPLDLNSSRQLVLVK